MFRWFTELMNIPLGDFRRGGLAQAPFVWQGQRIAPNICYEDLFGDEIGAGFRNEDEAPTVLLNVSNIAWFGDSVAIDQHLAISRMRALEFQRPMVRATNTGATAVIDHRGRVTHALPRAHARRAERRGRRPRRNHALRGVGLAPRTLAAVARRTGRCVAAGTALRRSTGQSRSLPGLSRPSGSKRFLIVDDLGGSAPPALPSSTM